MISYFFFTNRNTSEIAGIYIFSFMLDLIYVRYLRCEGRFIPGPKGRLNQGPVFSNFYTEIRSNFKTEKSWVDILCYSGVRIIQQARIFGQIFAYFLPIFFMAKNRRNLA